MEKKIQKRVMGFFVIVILCVLWDSFTRGRVQPEELAAWLAEGREMTVIDVRSRGEYEASHVPGAVHIPFASAVARAGQLRDRPRPFIMYCGHGPRATLGRLGLRLGGVGKVMTLEGHYARWEAGGFPMERPNR